MKGTRTESESSGSTTVDVEVHLLERAKSVLGVRTARRAVELALREVIRRERARRDLGAMPQLADETE
ncbi:type II toxin-antitoxin system VapB family antitoxin [Microlunatus parietis]|uniref:Arc/MetJ family transcription regulator n=1 Tax=Microlunatus parietis TaxID=682979 RepID=A0A7Y9IDX3_9ACTN|nr:type II toxin-antitoxin system VapB family antitoxin [Microlunatus parietis]NYE74811.1 Arc/MetJ family transcription regulator [Microlunatus parietis]